MTPEPCEGSLRNADHALAGAVALAVIRGIARDDGTTEIVPADSTFE